MRVVTELARVAWVKKPPEPSVLVVVMLVRGDGGVVMEAVEAVFVDAVPVEAVSVDAVPVDSAAVDAVPVDAVPVEAEPVDAVPVEAVPVL